MKLCWDNIENIRLTKSGNFRNVVKGITYYLKICGRCGEEFLGHKGNEYCSVSCASKRKHTEEAKRKMSECKKGKNNPFYGKHHTEETRKKISEGLPDYHGKNNNFYGKRHTEETKRKIGIKNSNIINCDLEHYIRNYKKDGIPLFDTYSFQIEWCEEVRRNQDDPNILEVKCFKCGEWFIPKLSSLHNRLQVLKNNKKYKGEHKFYCSKECKNSCSIYGKKPEYIMKQDAIRAGRLPLLLLGREVQPELRKLVLERDGYECIKCGSKDNLQCHHIYPVSINPIESADMDNCVTLCMDCHKEVHQKDGCKYNQLKLEEC